MEGVGGQHQGVERLVFQHGPEVGQESSDIARNCHIISGAPMTHESRNR